MWDNVGASKLWRLMGAHLPWSSQTIFMSLTSDRWAVLLVAFSAVSNLLMRSAMLMLEPLLESTL